MSSLRLARRTREPSARSGQVAASTGASASASSSSSPSRWSCRSRCSSGWPAKPKAACPSAWAATSPSWSRRNSKPRWRAIRSWICAATRNAAINELHRPAAIVFPDGSAVAPPGYRRCRGTCGSLAVPPRSRWRAERPGPPPRRRSRPRPRGGPPPSSRPPDGAEMRPRTPFGNPRRGPVMAPIEHNDEVVAVVWVPPLTGLQRVAEEIGTPLAIGAMLLLVGGTVIATLVIFRPGTGAVERRRGGGAPVWRGRSLARARRKSAATKWRPSPPRSIAWPPIWRPGRRSSSRPTARGVSCWPTSRTS